MKFESVFKKCIWKAYFSLSKALNFVCYGLANIISLIVSTNINITTQYPRIIMIMYIVCVHIPIISGVARGVHVGAFAPNPHTGAPPYFASVGWFVCLNLSM